MAQSAQNKVSESSNPAEVPRRIAIFPKPFSARFEQLVSQSEMVMTFPHLIIREMICFQLVLVFTVLLALFIDAPLEELADPRHTPNPAKAPWYFLGLQELLHSYPPVVAGVIIPTLVILALIAIPYFRVNQQELGLWEINGRRRFYYVSAIVLLIAGGHAIFDVFSVAIPTLTVYGLTAIAYFFPRDKGRLAWLSRRPVWHWVMIWFVLTATVLTVIGTFFRGPGWTLVWPL